MKLAEWFLLFNNVSNFAAYRAALTHAERHGCNWHIGVAVAEDIADITALKELINAPD